MKLLLCANVRLWDTGIEDMDVAGFHKWQTERIKKFEDLIDKAAQNNVSYVFLFGRIFGSDKVPSSMIDTVFYAAASEENIHTVLFLVTDEYKRIAYRNDRPKNLHLLCLHKDDKYIDDNIELCTMNNGEVSIWSADDDHIYIEMDKEDAFILKLSGVDYVIPSFEPVGFENANSTSFGYGILEFKNNSKSYAEIHDQKYVYKAVELKILPEDGQNDILRKINAASAKLDRDTFLRLSVVGRSAFGLTLNSDALKEHLQSRVFYAEVYDNTIMDIDEDSFQNDISLRSEFVRLALQDGSLSDLERNRLISCGWNALSSEEVTAE